jgi:hypothetical protein
MRSLQLALVLLATIARSDYFIEWGNTQGGITTNGTTPIMSAIGNQVLFQLWYAGADNTPDSILYDNSTTNGDDQLLDSYVFTANNVGLGLYANDASQIQVYGGSGTTFLGPSVYMRVFSTPTISIGSFYANSQVSLVTNKDFSIGSPTPDPIDFTASIFTASNVVVAIPEPGTLATIAGGLAVVVFGLRRRRYRI